MSEETNMNNTKKEDIEEPSEKDSDNTEKFGKPIVIKAEAYKTVILYASRYANQEIPPEDWKEIYGILIGYSDDDFVYVESAEALTFGHSTDVQLDERHYGFIDEIEGKQLQKGTGHYMVGWFHSHPGLTLFFSYIDLNNQLGFQQYNPNFCGLVFDHTLLGKKKEEKIQSENGAEHSITKYDTGFEIYRITDINMDVNAPDYDNNYHKVDYIVKGLNKFFFANVLAELSALASVGKPLQAAYGEDYLLGPSETTDKTGDLARIPVNDDIEFNVNNFFYNENKEKDDNISRKKEQAEQLIYEGNQAFKEKDAFTGVEKFRQGIAKYEELNENDKVLELLNKLTKKCIVNNHVILAEEFVNKLHENAKEQNSQFYEGEAKYFLGSIQLKKGEDDLVPRALENIQNAAANFHKESDHAGAGICFYKIGSVYQSRLGDLESTGLFFKESIEELNKAILNQNVLRKSFWSKPESLKQKIVDLRDQVENIIPNIKNEDIKKKIIDELKGIQYNF